MRKLSALFGVLALLWPGLVLSQAPAPTYECDGGPNAAIVNACAVRWEAANIRAHVALRSYGGSTPKCLTRTASLLDDIAQKWLKRNSFRAFNGPWPCGKDPAIAKADDGVLAGACPNRVWSYDNRGANGCRPGPVVAQFQPPAPTFAPTPIPFDFDNLANLLATSRHYFRWWDGGSLDNGDYHDRTDSTTASFDRCNFTIGYNESDADGRIWDKNWTGNLRSLNPSAITVSTVAARPANWLLRLETTGRAPLLQFTGSFRSAEGATSNLRPNDATSVVTLVLASYPATQIAMLRNAINWCRSQS